MDYFYPTDVLVTGYDIIFFWVIRMVFSAIEQTGKVPFHHVQMCIRDRPLTVLSAIRQAGTYDITVKGGKFLEAVAEAETIVLDKTYLPTIWIRMATFVTEKIPMNVFQPMQNLTHSLLNGWI